MGYRMAKNFRTKMSPNDRFIIHDVDAKVLDTFAQEVGKGTKIAKDARQVAEESVSSSHSLLLTPSHKMMSMFQTYDLSWPPLGGHCDYHQNIKANPLNLFYIPHLRHELQSRHI
jgi:hypothetical protein